MKIALLFPGQGAQKEGMGLDLYQSYPEVKDIYDAYPSIRDVCFYNANDGLSHTLTTQQAILLTSTSFAKILTDHLTISAMAGLSLGEYSACVSAQALTIHEAMPLIKLRGQLMQDALENTDSGMSAIISEDFDLINSIIEEANTVGLCTLANINAPNQVVMSGDKVALAYAKTKFNEAGIRKVIPLRVSGAFHSAYLKPASLPLKEALSSITWSSSSVPIVMNVDALAHEKDFIEPLSKQIYSSVMWMKSLQTLRDMGIDTFIEVGPSSTLSSMIQSTCEGSTHLVVNDVASLEKVIKELL